MPIPWQSICKAEYLPGRLLRFIKAKHGAPRKSSGDPIAQSTYIAEKDRYTAKSPNHIFRFARPMVEMSHHLGYLHLLHPLPHLSLQRSTI